MASIRQPIGNASGTWSTKRKLRLLRTVTILLVLLWLIGRCTGGDDEPSSAGDETSSSTQKEEATTTTVSVPPNQLLAATLDETLPAPRYQSGGASIGGTIYLAGGLDETRNSTDSIIAFNPESGESSTVGSLDEVIHKPQSAAIGDKVFVFGGAVGDIRYPTISSFSSDGESELAGQLPRGRSDGVAVVSELDGSVFIVGGTDGNDASLDVWRTIDGTNFEVVAQLAEPARYPAVAISGSAIWVMGGTWESEAIDSIQKVDLITGTTEVVGTLPAATDHAMGFAVGGSVFVGGGVVDGARTNEIFRVDTNSGDVSPAGTLPERISDATVASVGGKVYLLGGLSSKISDQIIEVAPAG